MKITYSPLLILGLFSSATFCVEVHSPPSQAFISQLSDIDINSAQSGSESNHAFDKLTVVTTSQCNNQVLAMSSQSLDQDPLAYHRYVEQLWQHALGNEYFYIETQDCKSDAQEWITQIHPCTTELCGEQYVADKQTIWLNTHLEVTHVRQAAIGVRTPLPFDKQHQRWLVTGYFVEKGRLSDQIALKGFTTDQALSKSTFVDELTLYFPDGTLRQITHFNDSGVKNGTEHRYYPTGKIHQTARYLDGQLNGTVVNYHANGNIESNERFIHDRHADGDCEHYDAQGNLSRSHIFKNGEYGGQYVDYFSNGVVKTSVQYHLGIMVRSETFHANGNPESLYQVQGKQTVSERYNEQGQRISRDVFTKQVAGTYPFSHETWFANGKQAIQEPYDERGLRHGMVQSWYENGQPKEQARYEHGQVTHREFFSPQGITIEAISYAQNTKDGTHHKWSAETGKLIYELSYAAGIPVSAEKHFDPHNGDLVEQIYLDKSGQPLDHLVEGQAPIQHFHQGQLAMMSCGVNNQITQASQYIERAKNNDGHAQQVLGQFYYQCHAKELALQWLSQAAQQNNIDVIRLLITLYRTQDGEYAPIADEHMAWRYLQQAAQLQEPNALFEVGFHFLPSDFAKHVFQDWQQYPFVTPDEAQSFRYIKLAADLGNPKAIYAAGLMFQYGIGIDASQEMALSYYQKLQGVLPDLAQNLIAAISQPLEPIK